MPNITTFNTKAQYIYLPIQVTSVYGSQHEFDAIFDTGAPRTEFSDRALLYAGFIKSIQEVPIVRGLQTQKYDRIFLPKVKICGHNINNLDVFVSTFEESWGIDALVGLDFARRFKIEIDYSSGVLITDDLERN
jgi:hypothetical protein